MHHVPKNRVREQRLRALVRTQKELAKRVGISQTTLSDIENNKRILSVRHALPIAQALGCSLDDLYEKPIIVNA